MSTDDLPQDVRQCYVVDGDEIRADVLVYGGYDRRAMLRVVVPEAERAGRVLIVIGEGEPFGTVVADPHVFSNVQLGSVRKGERRTKTSEIIRSGVSQQLARQQEPCGLVFVNEAPISSK